MTPYFFSIARLAVLALALFVTSLACLSTSDQPGPKPSVPAAPVTPSPIPSPAGTVTPDRVFDLAQEGPLTTIYGTEQGAFRSDHPSLTVGDFNGDGIHDILLGARFASVGGTEGEKAGAAYVVFGSSVLPDTVDLGASDQDLTILGPHAQANLGFSTAAGDLNGDGIDDIIVGAPFAGTPDNPQARAGAVYVIFGRPDLGGTVDVAAGEQDLTFPGTRRSSLFGDALAVGDINSDGMDDLIVGATFDAYTGPRGSTVLGGATYIYVGRSHWPPAVDTSAAEYDVAIFGAEMFDELGDFVASADINGDGFDDVIMTAEAADGPSNARPNTGEVHVVYGASDLGGDLFIGERHQDVTVYGARSGDTLGFALATGDGDGDGTDDLLMGARLADAPDISAAGHVYVLLGGNRLPEAIDLDDPPAVIAGVYGAGPSHLLGSALATGDLLGEGRDQLIMGTGYASGPDNSRRNAGAVYIVDARGLTGLVNVATSRLRALIYGASSGDRLGAAVASGDVTGDGRQELIVMAMEAPGADGVVPAAARIYVISLSD